MATPVTQLRRTSFAHLQAFLLMTAAMSVASVSMRAFSQSPSGQSASAPQPALKQPRTDRQGDVLPAGAVMRLGTVRLRNPNSFLGLHTATLAYTRDGRWIVSGGQGGAVVWSAGTGREVRRLGAGMPSPFGPAHVSPDGTRVAIGGWGPQRDTAGAVYELGSGRHLYSFGNNGSQFTFGRFSPDGKLLAVFGLDNDIQLHDAGSGKRLRVLAGHTYGQGAGLTVVDVVFTPDSKTLISAGVDGTHRLWDIATATEKKRLVSGTNAIRQIALSADGKLLASQAWVEVGQNAMDGDQRIRIWDVASAKEIGAIHVPPRVEKADHYSACLLGLRRTRRC
jgi:WD40 repeat protein